MLNKRLYRDISDLLELNVSDEKITRIMMVRGFTSEQVRRIIKEIRTKGAPLEEKAAKQQPVSETIETGPSKRMGLIAKWIGGQTEQEALAEELEKVLAHERALKAEEERVHVEVKRIVQEAQPGVAGGIPHDVKEVLRMFDGLLARLPAEEIKKFSQSPNFGKYKSVLKKYLEQ